MGIPFWLMPPPVWPVAVPGTYGTISPAGVQTTVAQVDPERCVGCGRCVQVCPTGAISLGSDGKARVRAELCQTCGLCFRECPRQAILLV